ncbi:hypothetical protein [Actinacidiphila rubida]|uniref:Uncharacterized protein n=1 Tax=Actinacidiphila rubida TaxID=310780 RepID=A0A1H8MBL3_9ACTN|nr:hypothetical protein [Actinacidiphila rubida]SEO14693.1 hypothetical protein SAMN05216267_1018122 [Actinacidiphila rubida]
MRTQPGHKYAFPSSDPQRFLKASEEFAIITMRKGLAAAGVVALISVATAACGSDTTTPQGKVDNAFEKLGQQNTLTLGLGFDGSTDEIYNALKGEDDFTRDNAKLLSSLRLSLSVSSQKSLSLLSKDKQQDGKDGAVAFSLSTDGSADNGLVEVRYVDQKAYLRADLKGLEKLAPGSANSPLDQFLAQADQLPSSLASVKAALKGQWVSLDPKAFGPFLKSLGGDSASGDSASGDSASGDSAGSLLPGVPKVDAATQKRAWAALKKALATNVTYKDLGNRDGADHVQVSAPARQLATALSDSVAPILKNLPGYDAKSLDPAKVPNKTLAVDVAIKGGTLSAITFDVAQLDDQAKGKLPLTLSLNGSARSISAPAGAQVLNPQDIIGLFMSGMPGLPGMPGSSDSKDSSLDTSGL